MKDKVDDLEHADLREADKVKIDPHETFNEEKEQWSFLCSDCGKETPISSMHTVSDNDKLLKVCDACYTGRKRFEDLKKALNQAIIPNYSRAFTAGFIAAIAGSLIWFGFVVASGMLWGFISMVIGYLVGYSVVLGSGNHHGLKLQLISFILTAFSIMFGVYLVFNWYAYEVFGFFGMSIDTFLLIYREYLKLEPRAFLDFLFYGIALYFAVRIPMARRSSKA